MLSTNNFYEIKFIDIVRAFLLFFILIIFIKIEINIKKSKCIPENSYLNSNNKDLDQFQTDVYNRIQVKLEKSDFSVMTDKQRKFINGIIRKYRPKKIVEMGVYKGGSSAIILNAIQDIEGAQLFSIDIAKDDFIGIGLKQTFPELTNKWKLYIGNIAVPFLNEIGEGIDMVMIDTAHIEPGEIMDFLMVLPYLKEEAIVCFHDIGLQLIKGIHNHRNIWAPYKIYSIIRGVKFFPSGEESIYQNIGGIILAKRQRRYVHDYFMILAGQWQYFPSEEHIASMRAFVEKKYDKYCLKMFDETVQFNRELNIRSPMYTSYLNTSLIKQKI